MKRIISLALVICLVLFLLTPAVFAFSVTDDLVVLDLADYYVKSEQVADLTVQTYKIPHKNQFSFQWDNAYGSMEGSSYSFENVTGANVMNCGIFVPYFNPPADLNARWAPVAGNEMFAVTDIPAGSYVTFSFPYTFSHNYSKDAYGNLVSYIEFYADNGLSISNSSLEIKFDVKDTGRNLEFLDKANATITNNWPAGSYSGNYEVSFYWPENAAYFSIGFGLYLIYVFDKTSYSFSFGDCTLTVEGEPYPNQPDISYNWSDTGSATFNLADTTAVPLQVFLKNMEPYGTYTYQWYSGQRNKYDFDHPYGYGMAIEGATSASYRPPLDHLGTYWYYCIVSHNSAGVSHYTSTIDCLVTVVDPSTGGSGGGGSTDPTDPSGGGGGSGTDPGGDSTTPTDPSGGGGSGGDSGGDSGGSSSDPTTSDDKVAAEIEKSNNLLENIVNGILNLPQLILDGIKGLFVPDAEAMAAYKEQWEALLSQRFGAIYESVQLIDDFVSSIELKSTQGYISFPEVSVDLVGTTFTFGGWNVQVVPSGFEAVVEILKKIISIVATLAFLNSMRNKFENILGGAS